MVLISVDFPQPLGPSMATCSPASITRLSSLSARLVPRMTEMRRKSRRAGEFMRDKVALRVLVYQMFAMIKNRIIVGILGAFLLLGAVATAQKPARNISGARHPNLAAAQRLSRQAWQRVVDAQQADEWDMQVH